MFVLLLSLLTASAKENNRFFSNFSSPIAPSVVAQSDNAGRAATPFFDYIIVDHSLPERKMETNSQRPNIPAIKNPKSPRIEKPNR